MAEKDEPKLDTVEEAKKRYETAKSAYSATRSQAIEDTKFYLGDSDNGWQWPQNIALQRSTVEKRPCLTINITAQHVNQIINTVKENPPEGTVLPVDDYADKKTAEILSDLIRNIQTTSSADDIHNLACEHAVVGGEGYWRIVTEYEDDASFNQVVRIEPILDPGMVYIDPFTKKIDKSDAEWAFVFEDLTKDECDRLWPDLDVSSWVEDSSRGWVKADTVRVADYYELNFIDELLYQLPDGSAEFESRIPPEILVQLKQMVEMGQLKTRKAKRRQWMIHKLVGNHSEPVSSTEWVGSTLPVIEIVGKEMVVNGEVVKKGLVRDLKDSARMVNYSYSAAIESVALQNKIPYIAPMEAIEGYEQKWDTANVNNYSYLPYNHVDDQGNPIPPPTRQQPAVMPAAQIQLLQLSVEQMRAASGQQNANFGIRSEAQSGVGIQRLKVQGEIATYHFIDALNRALKAEIRILLELICSGRIYDTQRVVRVLGIDGSSDHAVLDPNAPQAYQENQITGKDIQRIFNPTIGTYDVVIDTGPSYMTKRQEGAAQLTQMTQQNPQLLQVAGDLIFKAMDVPYAPQIAERLQKMLPPQLQENQGQQDIPPQVKQAMDMATQHIQQQDQQLQQLQQALQSSNIDQMKLENERMKIENERIKIKRESQQPPEGSLSEQALLDAVTKVIVAEIGALKGAQPPAISSAVQGAGQEFSEDLNEEQNKEQNLSSHT